MRVPLDYYRILGLPLQATVEQIRQAHHDRLLQLPRRGYSEAAIAARKQLIDEAYTVLFDPEKRQTYNAAILGKAYQPEFGAPELTYADRSRPQDSEGAGGAIDTLSVQEPSLSLPQFSVQTPAAAVPTLALQPLSLEIDTELLIGALMILLELGQYEQVLSLAQPCLGVRGFNLNTLQVGEPSIAQVDIVLTVALAYLEMGREQWHQGQYENAAVALDAGQELLLREGVFATLRGEIQADLYKLRPYRVLELLALPDEQMGARRHGMKLLCDMLQERGGIDGTGKDQSGLTIDDFLRFIQQLRSYLTAAEQQILFEEEARRPSAVATYLAVYALIARGFVEFQPALIRRAKAMLNRLSSRQDVYLEQSVCALLLGQTQEASRALESSSEDEALLFIEENSQGSPDLLPGLCLYSERWLQEEVFPHFRDLANRRAVLKEYFADSQVQAYLEELPVEMESTHEWEVVRTERAAVGKPTAGPVGAEVGMKPLNGWKPTTSGAYKASAGTVSASTYREAPSLRVDEMAAAGPKSSAVKTAERETVLPETTARRSSAGGRAAGGSRSRSATPAKGPLPDRNGVKSSERSHTGGLGSGLDSHQQGLGEGARRNYPASSTAGRSGASVFLPWVLGLLLLVGVGAVTLRVYQYLTQGNSESALPDLQKDQPMVGLNRPLIEIPEPDTRAIWKGPLDKKSAELIIQAWLNAKAIALGPNHDGSKLKEVLTDPVLSKFQKLSEESKREDWYRQYKYRLSVDAVKVNQANPESAEVEASVNETAELFEGGVLNQAASADWDLKVRYELVRRNGEWRIRDIVVLR
ncbi:hypothetical protein BST81_05575 [Leptolyngbya sp. 'hensonii']|uniref:IMS domain-containing protein n=1 Tax=Leptolyngbya sp. 'hensonii' TaxID=1922337 RepID=UPI00094F6BD9|nr:IMS domain-containing protein [Leptolyngbya sp. 'hensonii']OLP19233.1 hypothetical protein BST81_05575 [Leptolyngbya sp. 'hensonii']